MGPIAGARAALQAQRGQLFPFVPVFLGLGIGVYFCLRTEPPVRVLAALAFAGAAGLGAGGAVWRGLRRLLVRRGSGREVPGDAGSGTTLGHGGEDAGSEGTAPEERGSEGAEPAGGGRLGWLWRAAVPRPGGLRQAGLRAAALV
ncbi:hypothetical protein E0K89_022055, partial [Aquicoccus sp. SCR17]|nr:hypothetical protein [Carideicomes alvinocaridis]